jgi:hypothetical protein
MKTKITKENFLEFLKDYFDLKQTGKLAFLTFVYKNNVDNIQNVLDQEYPFLKNIFDLKQKFYMIFYNIKEEPLCKICNKILDFDFKNGFIQGMKHRSCRKSIYQNVINSYNDLIGNVFLLKCDLPTFFKRRSEVKIVLNQFRIDYPLFSNYDDSSLLFLFGFLKTLEDILKISECKYCKKYKVIIKTKSRSTKILEFHEKNKCHFFSFLLLHWFNARRR